MANNRIEREWAAIEPTFLSFHKNRKRNERFQPFPAIFYNKDGDYKWAGTVAKAKALGVRWDTTEQRWFCRGKWRPDPPKNLKPLPFREMVAKQIKIHTRALKIFGKMFPLSDFSGSQRAEEETYESIRLLPLFINGKLVPSPYKNEPSWREYNKRKSTKAA